VIAPGTDVAASVSVICTLSVAWPLELTMVPSMRASGTRTS
jgi:hypothetical protein